MEFSIRSRGFLLFLVGMATLLYVISCAHQPEPTAYNPPGFFMGLIHGFTILFSFLGSIFFDIRIYAFPNSGFFYDIGYLLGAGAFLGGGGATAGS